MNFVNFLAANLHDAVEDEAGCDAIGDGIAQRHEDAGEEGGNGLGQVIPVDLLDFLFPSIDLFRSISLFCKLNDLLRVESKSCLTATQAVGDSQAFTHNDAIALLFKKRGQKDIFSYELGGNVF